MTSLLTAAAASRADEEEPGGSAQGARGKKTSVRGGENELGEPTAHPRAAETRRLKVQTVTHTNKSVLPEGLGRFKTTLNPQSGLKYVEILREPVPFPLEGAVYPFFSPQQLFRTRICNRFAS